MCLRVRGCECEYTPRMWDWGERKRIHVFQFYTLHNFRKSSKTSVALDKIYDTHLHARTHRTIYFNARIAYAYG